MHEFCHSHSFFILAGSAYVNPLYFLSYSTCSLKIVILAIWNKTFWYNSYELVHKRYDLPSIEIQKHTNKSMYVDVIHSDTCLKTTILVFILHNVFP